MNEEKNQRVKGRLKLSNSKLSWILEITTAINNNSTKGELFEILRNLLIKELHIGRFALYTYQKDWKISMIEGISEDKLNIDINELRHQFTSIDVLTTHENESLTYFDVVIPVFHKKEALAYLLLADFEGEKIEISPIIRHLHFIQTLANIIVVALENKRLNKEHIKQVEIRKELEMAQTMQSLLFPRKLPASKEITVSAYYLPHSEVGGDYYDVIPLKNGNTAICVADVSGKGVSAAILMANFQAHLRALLSITQDLEQLIRQCNRKIIESANYEKFITLFIAIFDPKERSLRYLNAGHPAGILEQTNRVYLDKGCTVLGMFEELPDVITEKVALEENSMLFCFSDGLSEMEDEEGNDLEPEVTALFNRERKIGDIHKNIQSKIEDVSQNVGLSDDITFMLARFLA